MIRSAPHPSVLVSRIYRDYTWSGLRYEVLPEMGEWSVSEVVAEAGQHDAELVLVVAAVPLAPVGVPQRGDKLPGQVHHPHTVLPPKHTQI